MKKIIGFICLNVLLFSSEIKNINLDEAIKIALENNKNSKITRLGLEIAEAQYNQAISANYPTINALLVGQRSKNDVIFQQRGKFELGSEFTKTLALANTLNIKDPNIRKATQEKITSTPNSMFPKGSLNADIDTIAMGRDTVKGSLNLQYPLYTGGKISSLIEQAKLNKLLAVNTIKREDLKVVYDTKKYFYGYILTNELYKIMKSLNMRMHKISKLTKTFYESGESLSVKKTDYLSVQVTVALIESLTSKVEANKILVESALVNVMGMPWNSKINPVYKKQLVPINYTLAKLVEEAYRNNKDITKMDIALKISKEQVKEHKSAHYPSLAFLADVSKTYNSYKYGFLNEDYSDSWNIGFAANIPIFDGFRTTNKINEKRVEEKKMYLLQDMVKEAVALQIKNELTKALIGFKQVQTLKKAKKIAKENRELNTKGYQIGAISPKDVIQAEYIESYVKADYLKYVHDYLISLSKIDNLIGKELK